METLKILNVIQNLMKYKSIKFKLQNLNHKNLLIKS